MNKTIYRLLLLCLLVSTLITLGNGASLAQTNESITSSDIVPLGERAELLIIADPDGNPGTAVAPPAGFSASQSSIESTNNYQATATGVFVSEWIGPWSPQAQAAFQYAVDIWNHLLDTNGAPVAIEATWAELGPGILGGASADLLLATDGNVYAAANLNAQGGQDYTPNEAEIFATFNSAFSNWYFGTDGNAPFNQYDFASVVLHEIGHGLGFFGSMRVENNVGSWGYLAGGNLYPAIYDRFTETFVNTLLITISSGTQLAAELQSNNIYFDGLYANAANCGSRVKLYAPSIWRQGSSYSHVDEIFNNTPNALMTYSLSPGEVVHDPGAVTLGLLRDTGWEWSQQPPIINGLPSYVLENKDQAPGNQAIDLLAYASDAESADCQLTFAITNSPDAAAGVTLTNGRYININPTGDVVTAVTVQVTDSDGQSSTDTFVIMIGSDFDQVYLPTVLR